jgi:hypothetical protein
LYWNVMNYHPDEAGFFEWSWNYQARPLEGSFELVETAQGKRWCRTLYLEIGVDMPKEDLPVILKLFQDHNAEYGAATEEAQAAGAVGQPMGWEPPQ